MAAASAGPVSQFSGTLMEILDRVHYSRVRVDIADDPVYRLRYEAYTREGFMPANAERMCADDLDETPNAMSFGIHIDGQLVSSLRLHHLTSAQPYSPSMAVFPDILGPMLRQGRSFIDPTRFTADHEASLAYPALPFLTLRIAVMASIHFDADFCLALVRPEHGAFYRRVFGSVRLGEDRAYPGLTFPTGLYSAEVKAIRSQVMRRYPFFLSTEAEREWLFTQAEPKGEGARMRPSAQQAYQAARKLVGEASA